jgi:predicted nucleic acid-binding protein
MKTPKIYLETTMFNFPFADDSPQYKADTIRLFSETRAGRFEPYTSEYVIDELNKTTDEKKRELMKALIAEYNIKTLPATDETKRLADMYVLNGIIPERFATDALHIASATVNNIDFIVSLNFQHIVKHTTIIETEIVNAREGYKRVFIHTPAEVIEYDA